MIRFLVPLFLCAAAALAAPRINEVQSTNTAYPDAYGQLMDWVEIHNPTSSSIDLTNYCLSDSLSNKTKFRFPATTTLTPGAYLLVWCGQSSEFLTTGPYPPGQARATNFNISSGGESIVLTAPDGSTIIDEFPALVIGSNGTTPRSLGRGLGENFSVLYFYNTPTQGTANTNPGVEAIPLDPPTVSLGGGIYTSNQSVTIQSSVPGTTIRYTLDGSDPTESSPVFSSALEFGPGGNNATGYSWIRTNQGAASGYPYYDEWQSPNGSVARIHVLRTRAFKSGSAPSRIVTESYLIHPSGADRHTLPVVSIASDPANLFDNKTGIYVYGNNTYSTDWPNTPGAVPFENWANYYQSGSAWERPSHLEFFENGTTLLKGQIGLRLNGNTTRNRPRKALRIYNRNPAGSTTWTNTQLFPDRDTTSWDTFLLRAAGNDWNQALFRDALVSAIAAPTGLDRQAARPVVLYLNGEFWGIHNLRERIDEAWVFHKYGLGEDQFSMLEVTAGAPNFLNPTSDNSWPIFDSGVPALLDDYKDILIRAGNNEFASGSSYDTLNSRIDLENFADYCAITIWAGNTDWPGNNILLWRSTNATNTPGADPRLDGRWRYIVKDNDFALGLNLPYVPGHNYDATQMAQHDTLAYATSAPEPTFANNEIGTRLLRKTIENPVFKNQFINRFADLLNTTLSVNATVAQLDAHIAAYSPAIAEHSNRWPTPLNWNNEVERIRTYLQTRTGAVRSHIASKFNTTPTNLTVDGNATQGTIQVNSLTLAPSTPGIAQNPFPWTGTYFQNIPVTVTADAKPGYRFVSWTENSSAGFIDGVVSTTPYPAVAGSSVTITYNPVGRPLEIAESVYLHFAPNEWNNRVVPRPAMTRNGAVWQYTYTVPSWATTLRTVFTATPEGDDSGPWDNNNGSDWNIPVATGGTTIASDSTSNYSGWDNGNNGGNGFGAWSLTDTESSDDGFFIAGSDRSIHSSTPDNRSFGIFAHSGGNASATRPFSSGNLTANQTFSVKISPGAFSGSKGLYLSGGGSPLFTFFSTTISGNRRHLIRVGSATPSRVDQILGTNQDYTFTFSITRLSDSNNEHRITITRDSTSYSSIQTLASPVDRVVFYNTNTSGSNDSNNLYFNQLEITDSAPISNEPVIHTSPTIQVAMDSAKTLTALFELEPATTLLIETPPAAIPGTALPFLRVKAANSAGDTDGNYDAQSVTLTITGPNGFSQTYQSTTTAGIAEFTGITLPATGEFSLSATSGSLSTASPQTFSARASARFLPTGNATWTTAENWDIQAIPNNNLASATIPAPQNQTVNRDATIQSPVTIASVLFENGASAFRNRISGTTGNALTFASANGTSSITVTGNGTGHANIEVSSGVVAQNDIVLDVQNTAAGNSEYGALRLQGRWSGSGGFIKRGPGLAGITGDNKTFSGNITIEQGVLTFSEPAVSTNSASRYTVLPGGQLRLSSTGNPRLYRFSGPIHLAGSGRSGVPDNENLGVLGALRLETGATGGNIFIENSVVLTAAADIHIPALNTVTLNSTLLGNTTLTKSGGGTLALPASTSGFRGGITVNRGILHLTANLSANTATLELAANSTLSGNGTWGGLLRLPSGVTLASELASAPLRATTAQIDSGALVTFTTTNQTASGLYPLLTLNGSSTTLQNISLASVPTLHPSTRLAIQNGTLYALVAANSREAWLLENNLPTNSPETSDPDTDTFSNLIERALGMNPTTADATLPTSLASSEGIFTFTYRIARNQPDLTIVPQFAETLSTPWLPQTPQLHDDSHPAHQTYRVTVPSSATGFLRLKISTAAQ